MPLIRVDPPTPLPRGTAMVRPWTLSSGSVAKRQLYSGFTSSLEKPAGIEIHMLRASCPASSISTRYLPSALRRLARMQPAVPPPAIMKS
ncbi:hypothetical protein D3C78_1599030 [compost metagenome]